MFGQIVHIYFRSLSGFVKRNPLKCNIKDISENYNNISRNNTFIDLLAYHLENNAINYF